VPGRVTQTGPEHRTREWLEWPWAAGADRHSREPI